MPGKLYIVATPIGNLQDITPRAIETLRSVDLIACEDTRHTQKLLNHLSISTPTISYHEHNETGRAAGLIERILAGESIAVVSDAGTPAISDPGFVITAAAHAAGVEVNSIPGASALVAALASSGISAESFFFGGFLPARSGERRRRLNDLREIPATLIFYEAPHRLGSSLRDCLEVLGNRRASIARELTKLHEQIVTAPLASLAEQFGSEKVRGEIVITIERSSASTEPAAGRETDAASRYRELLAADVTRKDAIKAVAKEFGLARDAAYRLVQNIRHPPDSGTA
jgi:16S rRNA (cytidine1402-2'-O)-methyltransferase